MGQLSFIWRYVVVMFVSLVFWEAKGTVQISTDVNNVFLSWIIYSLNMNGSNIYQQRNTLQFFFLLLVGFFSHFFLIHLKESCTFQPQLTLTRSQHYFCPHIAQPKHGMNVSCTNLHNNPRLNRRKKNPKPKTPQIFLLHLFLVHTLFRRALCRFLLHFFSLSGELFIFFPFGCLNKSVDFILFYPPVFVCLCVVSLLMHRPFNDTFYAISKYHLNRSQIFNWLQ